jgi:hypothetical protein
MARGQQTWPEIGDVESTDVAADIAAEEASL